MIDWQFPYPSQRMPVVARNVVATSQPLAAAAGLDAMRAAATPWTLHSPTAITLTVVEPNNNGVGSDAFAIVGTRRRPHRDSMHRARRRRVGRRSAFRRSRTRCPALGWDSVTVPGAVSAWVALSERFGDCRSPQLFDAAIAYAARRIPRRPEDRATTGTWPRRSSASLRISSRTSCRKAARRAPASCSRPDLARTLEQIAQSRGEAFYRGELAQRIARASRAAGGAMTATTTSPQHRADWVTPISQSYRDIELHEIPPNGQGLAAQIALAILRSLRSASRSAPDDERSIHLQIEAMKIAIRAAFDHFADAAAMRVTPTELLGARVARESRRHRSTRRPLDYRRCDCRSVTTPSISPRPTPTA